MADRLPSHREFEILSILINGSKYGREIRDAYQKRTNRRFPLGSLYTTLDRMEDKGFLKSSMSDATSERGGNRRKYFTIAAPGRRALDAHVDWVNAMVHRGLSHA